MTESLIWLAGIDDRGRKMKDHEPVVGDLLDDPTFIAFLGAFRDAQKTDPEYTALLEACERYYCFRCHRSHEQWSAIGKRHAGEQPIRLIPPKVRAALDRIRRPRHD